MSLQLLTATKCLYCYEPLTQGEAHFHQACNKRFFGQLYTPTLGYNLGDLQKLATQIIQSQMAVTGVQAKVSLSLHRKEDKNTTKKLTIVATLWRLHPETTIGILSRIAGIGKCHDANGRTLWYCNRTQ